MTERKDVTSIPRPDYRKIKHEKRPWRRRWLILSPMDGSLSRYWYAEGVDMDRTLEGEGEVKHVYLDRFRVSRRNRSK